MPSALSINLHTLLEEDPVAYIVVFPDYQEDEVTLQEPLKILRLPIVLAMKASERLNTQDSTSWTSDNSGRNKVWNFSGSVFMIIGDADTPWLPQFFSAATFESQSLTEEKRSWSIWQPPRCHGSSPAVSPCLLLLTFMTIHLFQFRFADTEQYWLMTRLCFDKPLEIVPAFLWERNTCALCW